MTWIASAPERLVRAGAAVLGGAVHETAQLVLPRFVRRSRFYEATAKNVLRITIELVGSVEGAAASDEYEPHAGKLAARKAVGNVVEFGSIAAFGFSPLWILAAVADVTRGSRVYLDALVSEMRSNHVLAESADIDSIDDLLGALEGASGTTARLIDVPPLELDALKQSLTELRRDASDLPTPAELAAVFNGLRATAVRERRSLLEVSTGVGIAFFNSARHVGRQHLLDPYSDDLAPLRKEGFGGYAARVSKPYAEAVARHFGSGTPTLTERGIERLGNARRQPSCPSTIPSADAGSARGRPTEGARMAANAETQAFLDEIAEADATPLHEMTPAEARETWHTMVNLFAGASDPVASIDDQIIPGPHGDIELRSYTPEGDGPFGALVYFHGGGWVIGTADTYQVAARKLANATGCKVFVPTYRMAPEYKYPIAVEDCYAAFAWIAANASELDVDPGRIAIGGDSAGGNLTAAVSLMARDKGGPAAAFQLLIYPVTDFDLDTSSYLEYADDHYLTRDAMAWFWDLYLPSPEAGKEVYASPLQAAELSGLPPALVITAECDVLCDEGEAYAAKLEAAGVPVTLSRAEGMIHGFMHPLGGRLPFADPFVAEAGNAIKAALA